MSRRFIAAALVPCALGVLSIVACSDGGAVSSDQLDEHATLAPKSGANLPHYNFWKLPHLTIKLPKTPKPKLPKPPEPKTCPDPTLGSPGNRFTVGMTAEFVDRCQTTGCPNGPTAMEVALDYGDFPFRTANLLVNGSFFYAVVEPGFENGGFLDGAPGNLSDTTASAAPGDRGSGDTEADRTITSDGTPPALFPKTHGTHAVSFPPSQFEAIQLFPFDVPPDGHCELAICPTGATSRCECAFATFDVPPPETDGGAGGTTGAGGMTESTGGTTHGAGGTTHGAGGTTHGAGGTTHGAGGTTHASGGSGGAPCDP
jgi:hypothetical protein